GPVKGLFYGDVGQLGAQMIDIVVGFIWAWGMAWIIFSLAKRFVKIRVSPEVELEGTDPGEFGQECYPDFVKVTETDGRLRPDDLAIPYLSLEEQAQVTAAHAGQPVGAAPHGRPTLVSLSAPPRMTPDSAPTPSGGVAKAAMPPQRVTQDVDMPFEERRKP